MPTVLFKNQNYSALRKQALSSGQLFEDPEFPPGNKSLYRSGAGSARNIEWKRPKDIVTNPQLAVEGVSSNDLVQGELGNCWLVAAIACIALHKSLWHQVIVDIKDQNWKPNSQHPGIFHFRFWRFGSWLDVVIDDRLPTRNGKLIYLRSPNENEFWPALLEKAYAKLFGCYEALDGGDLSEALEDFTGGVSESINLVDEKRVADEASRKKFFNWLLRAAENTSLMCASIPAKSAAQREKANNVGLVMGHAYSITAVRKLQLSGTGVFGHFRDKLEMVRLRNPWGDSEWKGPFSDKSTEWSKITKSDREKIGLTFDNDGEFWMTFEDFCRYYVNMSICHRVNTSLSITQKRWHEWSVDGQWTKPLRAGGCSNNSTTFFNNPQFAFDVTDDDGDELMFQLTQKNTRARENDKLTIGFTVIRVEANRRYRIHARQDTVFSTVFRNSRSIYQRQELQQGRYVLITCTFEPGLAGEYLLRAYAGHNIDFRELTLDKPPKKGGCCPCLPFCRSVQCVTQIRVRKVVGLARKERNADINPYCIIKCESESVRSPILKKTSSPEWDVAAVFYRKNPSKKPVIIEVYHHNTIGSDEYLGGLSYDNSKDTPRSAVQSSLKPKSNDKRQAYSTCGMMLFEVTISRQLDSI